MKRLLFIPLLCASLLMMTAQQQWQGVAAYGNSNDFPTQGYYAASSSFPINSIITVRNSETGKSVRVVVSRELKDTGILLTLSPDAARDIGLEAGRTVQVTAKQFYIYDLSEMNSPDELSPVAANPEYVPSPAPRVTPAPTAIPSPVPLTPPPLAAATPAATDAPGVFSQASATQAPLAQDNGRPGESNFANNGNIPRQTLERQAQTASRDPQASPKVQTVQATPGPEIPGFAPALPSEIPHLAKEDEPDTLTRSRAQPGARSGTEGASIAAAASQASAEPGTVARTSTLPVLQTGKPGANIATAPLAKDAIAALRTPEPPVPLASLAPVNPRVAGTGALAVFPSPVPTAVPRSTDLPVLDTRSSGSIASGIKAQNLKTLPSQAPSTEQMLARPGRQAGSDTLAIAQASPSPSPAVSVLPLLEVRPGTKVANAPKAPLATPFVSPAPVISESDLLKTQSGMAAGLGDLRSRSKDLASVPQAENQGLRPGSKGLVSGMDSLKTRKETPAPSPAATPLPSPAQIVAAVTPTPTPVPAANGSKGKKGQKYSEPSSSGQLAVLPTNPPVYPSPVPAQTAPQASQAPAQTGFIAGLKGFAHPAGDERPNPGDVARPDTPLDGSVAYNPSGKGLGGISSDEPAIKGSNQVPGKAEAPMGTPVPGRSGAEKLALGSYPQALPPGTSRPEAAMAGTKADDGSPAALAGLPLSRAPGQASIDPALAGTRASADKNAASATLPESRLPGQASVDPALAGTHAGSEKNATISKLPETRLPGQASVDPAISGTQAGAEKDATLAKLPETRLPGQVSVDPAISGTRAGAEKDATLAKLPETRLPGQASVDPAISGTPAGAEKDATLAKLPETRLPGQASVDPAISGTLAGAEKDAILATLPETRLPGQPGVDPALAGNQANPEKDASLSTLPASRVPGQSSVDPALTGPGSSSETQPVAGLAESRLPYRQAADPALDGLGHPGEPDVTLGALPLSNLKGKESADTAGSLDAPGALEPEVASMPDARDPDTWSPDSSIQGALPDSPGVAANLSPARSKDSPVPESGVSAPVPGTKVVTLAPTDSKPPVLAKPGTDGIVPLAKAGDADLAVKLPGASAKAGTSLDTGIASTRAGESPADATLAKPAKPLGPEAAVGIASPAEEKTAPLSLAQAQLLDSLKGADKGLSPGGTKDTSPEAALSQAKDPSKLADASITGPGAAADKEPAIANAAGPELGKDKNPATPGTTVKPETGKPGEVSLVPTGEQKPANPVIAKSGEPAYQLVDKLDDDSWYLQLGAYNNLETARKALKDSKTAYPYVILAEKVKNKKVFKVYLGPILEDEKGMLLYTFRAKGYKDAFVRKGREGGR